MPRVSDKRRAEDDDISGYLVEMADIIEMDDNAPDDEILDSKGAFS